MNATLWTIQGLLAAFFLMPAFTKLASSKAKLTERKMLKPGASATPVRMIGLLELLGSIGIIIPLLTGIAPILTPLAALGFSLIMIGAFAVHFKRKEFKVLPLLTLLFVLSIVVFAGRL